MNRSSKFFAFFLCGMAAALVPETHAAAGVTASPGQIAYTYTSPLVSVYADIQIGNHVSTSVTQNSVYNISGISQVGNTTKAKVVQTGNVNTSKISQTGHNTSATVIQFGNLGSLLN
jgi:hypothetical protein